VLLARLAQEHAAASFKVLRREWGNRRTSGFFKDVDRVAEALEARARRNVEIERKYLLSQLPPWMPGGTATQIAQGYLPGTRLVERLRAVQENGRKRFFRTIKVGTGLVRTELEEETSLPVFEAMWPLTEGRRLTKRRHRVPAGGDGNLAWEIDEFTDRDLVLAEIELPSSDTVVAFPDWLAPFVEREVTGEREYLNSTLAR
jgi:CYTH domain-containing protein